MLARYKELKANGHFDAARQVLGGDIMFELGVRAERLLAGKHLSTVDRARQVAAKVERLAVSRMRKIDETERTRPRSKQEFGLTWE